MTTANVRPHFAAKRLLGMLETEFDRWVNKQHTSIHDDAFT